MDADNNETDTKLFNNDKVHNGHNVNNVLRGNVEEVLEEGTVLLENNEIKKIKGPRFGVRHIQVVMLFLSMIISYGIRVNMSMAIVAMTDPDNEISFDWSLQTQSLILSSYFWGYISLQIPSGEMANRFGGKILQLIAIGVNSVVALLMPLGAYHGGWRLLCVLRVIQGLTQGFLLPSIHHLLGKWIPPDERSSMGTIVYAGSPLGTALQLLTSGFIAEYWGWSAIFYVNGIIGLIWTVAYFFLGANTPQLSTMITEDECHHINKSLGHKDEHKKLRTPWRSICTSVPLLGLMVATGGFLWGYWTLMTEIPTYMKQVMGVDIKSNGVISSVPYLVMYIMGFPFGFVADYVIKKKWLSVTATRKLSNSIGSIGPAIIIIAWAYAPVNMTVTVILLTIAMGLNVGALSGFLLVHLDMAPNFAAILMGITNSAGNIMSILAPIVAGALVKDEKDPLQWRKVFLLTAGISIVCNTFFVIFGSSQRQKWNEPEHEKEET